MFPDWCGSALITAAYAGSLSRACQAAPTFLAASASPSGPGAPGAGAEVTGLLDLAAAFCLDLLVPGDVQAVAPAAAGVQVPRFAALGRSSRACGPGGGRVRCAWPAT